MAVPTDREAIEAAKKIQSLSGPELEEKVRSTIGTPMLAIFGVLARHLEPMIDEEALNRRVHLMVTAYLLKAEVDGAKE